MLKDGTVVEIEIKNWAHWRGEIVQHIRQGIFYGEVYRVRCTEVIENLTCNPQVDDTLVVWDEYIKS
jgi:hypothetical protein